MRIVHLALGGCLRAPPVDYGLTADTGGHIAYVLAAAAAQAAHDPSATLSIVTRRFEDERLGAAYGQAREPVSRRVEIVRLAGHDLRYLEKEALEAELPAFTERFLAWLRRLPEAPAVIHAHFADAASVAAAARDALGVPFVYTPHALGLDKAVRCGGDVATETRIRRERRAIETADAIVVSSRDEADRQLAAYGVADAARRVSIVPPGPPTKAAGAPRMAPLGFTDPGRPLVLAIARPIRKKNLVGVADAFSRSRLREIANLAILAGQHATPPDGAEEREVLGRLRDILSEPSLAGRVALPPVHGAADVRALYGLAARTRGVFVSPALHEPFGLTLLEAAAAGVPVVATSQGGAADIVRLVGHGLTVDPLDGAAVASACLRVIEERGLHARLRAASARVADSFSWTSYARRSLDIYAGLCGAAPAEAAAA